MRLCLMPKGLNQGLMGDDGSERCPYMYGLDMRLTYLG